MHSFAYKNGTLYCENVNLQELADKEGTPLYVYSKQTILNHFHRLREALAPLNAEVAYAVKASSNIAILNLMARNGAGFDIVSGGELFRVLKAGGDPSKCTYAGVGKTEAEIRYALEQGIYCFNVESEAELRAIDAIAASMRVKAPVAVRVNPNVEAGTHKYITTGKAENKFGVDFELIEPLYEMAARELPNLQLKGLQMHIGSQLTQAKPFLEAVRKVAPLAAALKEKHGIEFFSIGGGIGLFRSEFLYLNSPDYPTEDQQFEAYKKVLADMDGKEVIIRTLDIGADKQIGYFNLPKEDNPAMGMRALRICLTRPEIFKTQLRALLRASAYGNMSIMFPMVTSVWEVREAKKYCEEVKRDLKAEGIPFAEDVQVGIMIETPAAAIMSDRLAKEVDFFSCGTNDLTQYTLACDRQNNDLGRFYDPHNPAVLRLLKMVTENAHKNGIWVGICGELGADLTLTETFLAIGVDELSVSPRAVLPLRNAVRMTDTRESAPRLLAAIDAEYPETL